MIKNKSTTLIIAVVMILLLILFLGEYLKIKSITGNVAGNATVTVASIAQITLVNSTVNFGTVNPGQSENTTTNAPTPFLLRNDGTVKVNITIARDNSSIPLFSGTGGGDNTSSFQFKVDASAEGVCAGAACSIISFTNVPGITPLLSICDMNFTDICDEIEVDLLINVPLDEPVGIKTEILSFIGYQA